MIPEPEWLDSLPPYLAALAALGVVAFMLWLAEGPERKRQKRLRKLLPKITNHT